VRLVSLREPRLTVRTPLGEAFRLLVEAGDDSIEVETQKPGETTVTVPAERPVMLLSEGARTPRLTLPPLAPT